MHALWVAEFLVINSILIKYIGLGGVRGLIAVKLCDFGRVQKSGPRSMPYAIAVSLLV